jgi:hypothetical protein
LEAVFREKWRTRLTNSGSVLAVAAKIRALRHPTCAIVSQMMRGVKQLASRMNRIAGKGANAALPILLALNSIYERTAFSIPNFPSYEFLFCNT